jgi:superfamily I DNA/RNA helicase
VMVGDESQAIYGWRGARDAMGSFPASHVVTLSQSFRFGQAVADVANQFLALLDAPLRLTGFEKIDSKVEAIAQPSAVLCRTNAAVIEHAMNALADGRKPAIVGGTGEIKSFANAAEKLMSGKRVTHADLAPFKSWGEVQEYSTSEEGGDLKVMVRMIDTHGVQAILDMCDASVSEDKADLIVSTAHKAKGREWDHVLIANDFKAPEEDKLPARAELMLAYVAVTRAKLTLDNAGLAWVASLV